MLDPPAATMSAEPGSVPAQFGRDVVAVPSGTPQSFPCPERAAADPTTSRDTASARRRVETIHEHGNLRERVRHGR